MADKKPKKTKKPKGRNPDADPTAPAGMSLKALTKELIKRHGLPEDEVAPLSWDQKIQRVCVERRKRELEAEPEESLLAEMEAARAVTKAEKEEEEARLAARPPLLILDPNSYDFTFDGHAGAGPSGSGRWMSCTASTQASREFLETLTLNQQYEFAEASEAAAEGTVAHGSAEVKALLMLGRISEEEADESLLPFYGNSETPLTEEMEEYIEEYLDLIRSYAAEGREIGVERRVAAAVPLPNGEVHLIKGSADMTADPLPTDPVLVVADLKYGDGLEVHAEENSQARTYALGVLTEMADEEGNLPDDIERIRYHIAQPRLGGLKTWEESLDDLLTWRDEVLSPALAETLGGLEGGAKFEPSEYACQFCPAHGTCAALAEDRFTKASDFFTEVLESEVAGANEFPAVSLSNERLAELLEQGQGVVKIVDALKAEAQRRLYRGDELPGYHLVNYTPPRKWKPEVEEVVAALDPRLVKRSLLSPTQAVKTLGEDAAKIEEFYETPDKRPVVAPINDRRKKWEGLPPESMFGKVED